MLSLLSDTSRYYEYLPIALDVANGMAYLHSRNIIHRLDSQVPQLKFRCFAQFLNIGCFLYCMKVSNIGPSCLLRCIFQSATTSHLRLSVRTKHLLMVPGSRLKLLGCHCVAILGEGERVPYRTVLYCRLGRNVRLPG